MAIIAILNLAIIISSSAAINANVNEIIAYAQLANNNNNSNIESVFPDNGSNTDRPPTFLDAYWSENLSANSSVPTNVVKKEVGPGDGISTLAIVLVNRGRSDITGVTGYLDLPTGFKPIAGKNNGTSQSVASFYSVVKAGNTFVLYFDMNVLDQAKVGGYSTSLNLKYSKINQMGQLITSINIPFRLTGRVVLDTTSENKELIPGSPNQLKVNIHNKGNANATAVVVTITGVTGNSVNSGAGVTSSSGNIVGNSNATSSIGLQQQQPSSSSSSSLSIPTVNLASQTFNIGDIPANSTVQLSPTIYPISSAGETAQNLNLQISYGDAYGNQKTSNSQVGLVIAPNPPQSVLNLTNNNNGSALILTAGKIQNMGFTLENNDKRPITNVVASLNSESDSMKILGDSRWTVQSMLPESKLNLSTKVFASSNIIGQPAVFTLTVQYVSAGQSKTDSLNLGAYIAGEIKIRVYDVHINNIGNVPNLVGNILNEGNTVGLFTSIQIINDQQLTHSTAAPSPSPSDSSRTKPTVGQPQRQQKNNITQGGSSQSSSLEQKRSLADFMTSPPPPQYLGDLSVDSPLPFSIPLVSNDNSIMTAPSGVYPVILKITYSDDLKIPHQFIDNNQTVSLVTSSQSAERQRGADGGLGAFGAILNGGGRGGSGNAINTIIILGAIAAVIVIAVLYIRRRRSRSKLSKLQANKAMGDDPFLDNTDT
ncbi:MAG TPA: hypothetical protein VE643_07535 [Nitrososphaeraceae archaeon]|nr:hypothetical protein [Nitrososphaeraceae archaeon]